MSGKALIKAAALALALGPAAAGAGEPALTETVLGHAAGRLAPGAWTEIRASGHEYALFRSEGHHIFEYTDDAAWYPARQLWLFIGLGHLSPPIKFVTYSAYTNTFEAMPTPPWAVGEKWGHAYDNTAIDARRGVLYHHQSYTRLVHAYDIAAGTWSTLPEIEGASRAHGTALAYFPEMDALVRVLDGTVHVFRLETRRWTVAAAGLAMGSYHNFAKYDARHASVVLGGGNDARQVYRLRADGTLSRLRNSPVAIGIGNSAVVTTDPESGDLLVFSYSGALHALDVARDRWRLVAPQTPLVHGKVVATPLVDHGVIMFVTIRPEKVLLYRYAAPAGREAG